MVKSGEIGDVLSVETFYTILSEVSKILSYSEINIWSAMGAWGSYRSNAYFSDTRNEPY